MRGFFPLSAVLTHIRNCRRPVVVSAFILLWLMPSHASAVTFTKIVDSFDQVPGQPPGTTFVVPGWAAPALSGKNMAFAVIGVPGHFDGLWSAKTDGTALTPLADGNTIFPGTSNPFGAVSPVRLFGKKVAFRGTDFLGHSGYFSIPVKGGALKTLADQDTPLPDAMGTFGPGIGHVGGSADGFDYAGHLVFQDVHSGGGGVYRLPPAGGSAEIVGNGNFFICEAGYGFGGIGTYYVPAISGPTVAMLVGNVFGHAAIYTTPRAGITGVTDPCATPALKANNVTRIASINDAVPDDPSSRNFDAFGFGRPVINKKTVVFSGTACTGTCDNQGIYSRIGAGALNKLVNTYASVPGGNGTFQHSSVNFSLSQYAVSGKRVVFRGSDADGRDGVYFVSTSGGLVMKIVAVGDVLPDGRTVVGNGVRFHQPPVQIDSLSGNKVGLRLDFFDPMHGTSGTGVYM
jgi:hypothetical protein